MITGNEILMLAVVGIVFLVVICCALFFYLGKLTSQVQALTTQTHASLIASMYALVSARSVKESGLIIKHLDSVTKQTPEQIAERETELERIEREMEDAAFYVPGPWSLPRKEAAKAKPDDFEIEDTFDPKKAEELMNEARNLA